MALQAVKLLAQYVSGRKNKVSRMLRQLGQVGGWSQDADVHKTMPADTYLQKCLPAHHNTADETIGLTGQTPLFPCNLKQPIHTAPST